MKWIFFLLLMVPSAVMAEPVTVPVETLWVQFQATASKVGAGHPDHPDLVAARKNLATRQADLSPAQVNLLLAHWNDWGGEELLPSIQRAINVGNPLGLIALGTCRPLEAWPMIVADLTKPEPVFFNQKFPLSRLLFLRPTPQLALDASFADEIGNGPVPLGRLTPFLCIYGTPKLLPSTLTAWIAGGAHLDPTGEEALLAFWIRSDPKAGAEALGQALEGHRAAGDRHRLLADVLFEHWDPAVRPVVLKCLEEENYDLVEAAVDLLARYDGSESIDSVLTALERFRGSESGSHVAEESQKLLALDRWHYTPEQQQRLENLAEEQDAAPQTVQPKMTLPSMMDLTPVQSK